MKAIKYVVALALLASNVQAGEYKYDAEDFKNVEKMAGKLTDSNFKKLPKWKAEKMVVMEFTGEFLQSKEVTNSVFSQRNTGRLTTKTSTIELGNEYYNAVISRTYDMVMGALSEAGFTVVPKENLAALEGYKSLDLDFEKTTKGYKGSMMSSGVTTKGVKLSAEGLGLFPASPLKAIKLTARMADLTNEAGADSALKISFYVDKGKKGSPVLKSFDVVAYADLRGQEVGFAGNKKMSYSFYKQNENVFKLKGPMANVVDISGAEKGSVDMVKYDEALMELISAAVDMMKAELKAGKKG